MARKAYFSAPELVKKIWKLQSVNPINQEFIARAGFNRKYAKQEDINELRLHLQQLSTQIARLNSAKDTNKEILSRGDILAMIKQEFDRASDTKDQNDFLEAPATVEFPPPSLQELPTAPEEDTLELSPTPSKGQLVWYASSPQKGLFYGRRLERSFLSRQTVYKITIDAYDPNRATFSLVDDEDTVRLALNIPDSYIAPGMELRGEGKLSESRDIGPIEPGMLEKEGDNWRIVKKGIVHYH